MTDSLVHCTPEYSKSWNQKLNEWFSKSGKKVSDIEKIGLHSGTFYDYRTGRIKDLSKVSWRNKKILYELTGLECFNIENHPENQRNEDWRRAVMGESLTGLEEAVRDLRRAARIIEATLEEKGHLVIKARVYSPTPEERADGVMQLIDILAEEVDYYRTATAEERQALVSGLQADPSSFGYVTQMLNAIYNGKSIDSWMMMAQAPSKVRKAVEKKK